MLFMLLAYLKAILNGIAATLRNNMPLHNLKNLIGIKLASQLDMQF